MKRCTAFCLVVVFILAIAPASAIAGVEPTPWEPPGKVLDMWTAPGQIVGLDPQPQAPVFTPRGQLLMFDPQPEPPGRARTLWNSPGQIEGFDPQPEPPGFTPIIQVRTPLS